MIVFDRIVNVEHSKLSINSETFFDSSRRFRQQWTNSSLDSCFSAGDISGQRPLMKLQKKLIFTRTMDVHLNKKFFLQVMQKVRDGFWLASLKKYLRTAWFRRGNRNLVPETPLEASV